MGIAHTQGGVLFGCAAGMIWASGTAWAKPDLPPLVCELPAEEAVERVAPPKARVVQVVPTSQVDVPVVDGDLTDVAWATALPNTHWVPVGAQGEVSAELLSVTGPWGWAVALRELRRGETVALVLDPNGLRERWWTVVDETVQRCGLDLLTQVGLPEAAMLGDHLTPSVAAPCVPEPGVQVVRARDTLEVFFPVAVVGPLMSAGGVHAVVAGGQRSGSTAPWGQVVLRPELSRTVALPSPLARFRVLPEAGAGGEPGLRVAVQTRRSRKEWGVTWRWRAWSRGLLLDEGTVDLTDARGRFRVALPEDVPPRVAIQVWSSQTGDAGWAPSMQTWWSPPVPPTVQITSPIYEDVVWVRWDEVPGAAVVEATWSRGKSVSTETLAVGGGAGWAGFTPPWKRAELAVTVRGAEQVEVAATALASVSPAPRVRQPKGTPKKVAAACPAGSTPADLGLEAVDEAL